ncbi:Yos1-like protein [Neolentinus lepideus HHB14362 ss-1]|uniref:Yos1-like protein n=1 Tax=Neolentinus lepideus HHB14362 ss-1 TaxID=1314782 RepID=A0A165S0N2_9AGAM|nr:Yos1-like protein [Neolentinus lepideus HHB14362 ss-1]
MIGSLGSIIYIAVLLINSIAILSEERFLARIGWSSSQLQPGASGFHQPYEQPGFAGGQADIGVKGRLINLISAVRTLMRIPLIGINLVIILYELVAG